MTDEKKTCANCAKALHGAHRSICLHVFDFVSSMSPICHDYVQSFSHVRYSGECVSFIKEKKYSIFDNGSF